MTTHMTSGLLIPAGLDIRVVGGPHEAQKYTVGGKGCRAVLAGDSHLTSTYTDPGFDGPALQLQLDVSNLQNFWFILSGGNFKGQMFVFRAGTVCRRDSSSTTVS